MEIKIVDTNINKIYKVAKKELQEKLKGELYYVLYDKLCHALDYEIRPEFDLKINQNLIWTINPF